LLCIYLQ